MKLIISIFFLLLLTLTGAGQSVSSVLNKAEKAMGGPKQINSLRGWSRTGTITDTKTGAKGRYRSQSFRPGYYYVAYDLDGIEREKGFNGKSGWERGGGDGLRTLTGDAGLAMQAEAAYRSLLWTNWKKDKSKLALAGNTQIDGKPISIVRMTTPKGVEFKLFIEQASGLLVREEITSGDVRSTFSYTDFRSLGASRAPYRFKMETGEQRYVVELSEQRPETSVDLASFDFPRFSGDPLPDVAKLLLEVEANEEKAEELLDQYSYVQRTTSREFGKDGVLRDTGSETYQLSFYKGNRIRRLIEKNGKPLTPREQEKADKDAADRVEEIEKELAKREKRELYGPPSEESRRVSISEVMKASRLTNPRRERFRGRDVIVFDFEPNPDFDFKKAKSMLKFFGKTAGVMWIDEKDKQVARLEAYLTDSFNVGGGVLAKLRKGASFTLEKERLNDEIWLPSLADINISIRVLLVKGINVNQEIRSYDFRKFATEVKDARVGESRQ
jgi:hypothetical protein